MPSIAVKDFGPIAHAEVDLKPLTVFIGANNTGKSYLALAIYSLSQALRGTNLRHRQLRPRRPYTRPRDLAQGLTRAVGNSDSQSADFERLWSEEVELQNWPPGVQQWVRSQSKSQAKPLSDNLDYELRRCFGSSLERMRRRGYNIESSDFAIALRDESTGLNWQMRCRNDELVTEKWESLDTQTSKQWHLLRWTLPTAFVSNDNEALSQLVVFSYSGFLLSGYLSRPHYLPASRTGILQGHKTLSSLIVGRASTAWIEPMEVERLPGVITDLIQALLLLEASDPPPRMMARIVEFLESDVVEGTVDIAKQLEYPDINYTNEAGGFQLHQVSSMVSEIAPLVLFLKYLVRPGHFFIFEEPESHLDPANQRRLARAISMMVKAGIRVLVTTHSDLFLNQINNLMQASRLPPRKRLRMGYKAAEVLSPSDVAAYVFRPSQDGTEVSLLPIDSDQGISTESFDTVHRALYDESIKMEHQG